MEYQLIDWIGNSKLLHPASRCADESEREGEVVGLKAAVNWNCDQIFPSGILLVYSDFDRALYIARISGENMVC
jgi:hypothetical protein